MSKRHDKQVISHLDAALRVWGEMDANEAMVSLLASALSLCELAMDADLAAGKYLKQRISEMVNERAPAGVGETIQ